MFAIQYSLKHKHYYNLFLRSHETKLVLEDQLANVKVILENDIALTDTLHVSY